MNLRNYLFRKLVINNYRLSYTLVAYSMYAIYGTTVGLVASVVDKNIINLFNGFIVGSVIGTIVAIMAYIKHPITGDYDPPFNIQRFCVQRNDPLEYFDYTTI